MRKSMRSDWSFHRSMRAESDPDPSRPVLLPRSWCRAHKAVIQCAGAPYGIRQLEIFWLLILSTGIYNQSGRINETGSSAIRSVLSGPPVGDRFLPGAECSPVFYSVRGCRRPSILPRDMIMASSPNTQEFALDQTHIRILQEISEKPGCRMSHIVDRLISECGENTIRSKIHQLIVHRYLNEGRSSQGIQLWMMGKGRIALQSSAAES